MSIFSIGQKSGADTNVRVRAALSALMTPAAGTLKTRTGMLDDGLRVTRTGGMGLSVSPGRCWVAGGVDLQYGYPVTNDAAAAVTVDDGSAAPRTDLVCLQVQDQPFDGSGAVGPRVFVVKGASGGGIPATPATAIKLAEQPVAAGVSAGTGGLTVDPVDRRPSRAVAAGGIVPVASKTERDALALYPGLHVFRVDLGLVQVNLDGTATGWTGEWRTIGATGQPGFANGWSNFGSGYAPAAFVKTNSGVVFVKATITGGTLGKTACTLPAGYRPAEAQRYPCVGSGSSYAVVGIDDSGAVVPTAGSTSVFIANFSFVAEK